jgi:hypothetical protein
MQVKKGLFAAVFVIAGSVLAFLFNFLLLDRMLMPDPCYYHSHEAGTVVRLFYEFTSDSGGHPFPTIFNFIFTIAEGGAAGYFLACYLLKRKWIKQAQAMQV